MNDSFNRLLKSFVENHFDDKVQFSLTACDNKEGG